MKGIIVFIGTLVMCGCSNGLELSDSNAYSFSGNRDAYFPDEIKSNLDTTNGEFFDSDRYTELLHQLHEKSLSDSFSGAQIIRLTVIRTFQHEFMIRVEERDDGRFILTEKELWRDKEGFTEPGNYLIGSHIEFDSTLNRFFKVKMLYKNPPVELEREEIEPVSKSSEKEINQEQWNSLIRLLNENSFHHMRPYVRELGFDGEWYLLETHSKNGYYVVDRWSPKNGGFKDIVDYLVSLAAGESKI